MKILETNYLGLKLKNPIVIGSSNLSSSVDNILKLEDHGAGAVILKSVFEEEISAHLSEKTGSNILDEKKKQDAEDFDFEIKDDTLEDVVKLIQDAKQRTEIPIIASVNCNSVGEWVTYSKTLEEAGADALELNLFRLACDVNQDSSFQEKLYMSVVNKVREQVDLPLSLKISPYSSNLASEISSFDKAGVDGVTMFNRYYNVDFDIEKEELIAGNAYSTRDDYHNTLRWISLMAGYVKCDLSASTGIYSAETAIKMLLAGAETVQVVSRIYKEGPQVIGEIIQGIKDWMGKKGYLSIDEFRGALHRDPARNSEVFERVQFMRYFRQETPKI